MKKDKISEATTGRLSIYLRCLLELENQGLEKISSEKMAEVFHLNSAQIRKDLANFGEFGVRGIGYNVAILKEHIQKILGLDREYNVCIIGSGRLGTALTDYYRLSATNFKVVALFDNDKEKIGQKLGNVPVLDIKNFRSEAKKAKIDLAVIAVPAKLAQGVLDEITAAGIYAVMNFAPVPLKKGKGIKIKTVDLTTSLESLSYFLTNPDSGEGDLI